MFFFYCIIFDHFHTTFMAPWIICCMNIWTCNMSKENRNSFIKTLIWQVFIKKATFWTMAFFIKDMDLIQNDNQNSDVHFQQNFKALHNPKPLSGSIFHSVTWGRFDYMLFNVWWLLFCICICLHMWSLVSDSTSLCFDPEIQYSLRRRVIVPPTVCVCVCGVCVCRSDRSSGRQRAHVWRGHSQQITCFRSPGNSRVTKIRFNYQGNKVRVCVCVCETVCVLNQLCVVCSVCKPAHACVCVCVGVTVVCVNQLTCVWTVVV